MIGAMLRRRIGGWRAALAVLGTAALLCAVPIGASAHTLAMPHCPAKGNANATPHPACFWPGFTFDSYVHHVKASATVSAVKWVRRAGDYELYTFTVTARYANELKAVCPHGGVDYSAIPCRNEGTAVGVVGRYVPGSRSLQESLVSIVDQTQCPGNYLSTYGACCPSEGTCTIHFQLTALPNVTGRLTFVLRLLMGELTKNPQNNLGSSGAEAPIAVTLPKPKA